MSVRPQIIGGPARWATLCLAAAGAVGGIAGAAQGAPVTLLSDGFGDADRDNNGTTESGMTATDPADVGTAWWRHQSGSLTLGIVDDSAGIGSGLALQLTPTSSRGLTGTFTRTTLNDGDSITLDFDLRITSATIAAANDRFRISLLDSKLTYLTADATSATGTATTDNDANGARDEGYGARFDSGTADGNTAQLYSTHSRLQLGDVFDSETSADYVLDDNTTRHFELTLTRSGDSMNVSLTLDGLAALTGTHAPGGAVPVTTTFDEVMFGHQGTPLFDYVVDNFQVTYTAAVPEPAGLGLLAIGGVGLMARRRRA
jgi:hypothetical protein